MSVHRYTAKALRADYIRACSGMALSGGLAALARGEAVPSALLGVVALLFLVFGIRTALRQGTMIEAAAEGLSISGSRSVSLSWHELDALKLRYYATRRDRTGGWMQLTLAGRGRRVAFESSLEDFASLAQRAARAAEANGVSFDPATASNLAALGFQPAPRSP